MKTYNRKARLEQMQREHDELYREMLTLTPAELRAALIPFGIGMLLATIGIVIAMVVVRCV
ncbi:hypothetical protein [Pseudomonas sp. efr-133-TYG-5]|jgi:hypothetical protein|uniref:hypothetical protein n=1 Tax=Pseudomonas sp. efr-133-TYG-5 TaxID=3040310 RepID=UPI002553BFDF|nr:hypothetical protein [Pseudomonas sp. efr-133-TYG-5]